MIAVLEVGRDPIKVTPPSGWRLLLDTTGGYTGARYHLATYSRTVGSGELSSYTWRVQPTNSYVDISVLDYGGLNASALIDKAIGADLGVTSTPTLPSITTKYPDEVLLAVVASWDWSSFATASGMNMRVNFDGNGIGDDRQKVAGATGPKSFRSSRTTNQVGQLLAVASAASTPRPTGSPTSPTPTPTPTPIPKTMPSSIPSGQMNCIASPHACGYPDATNTGVPAGTVLRSSGSLVVSTPGAIIDSLSINGTVTVRANNVTIKRSHIYGTGSWMIRVEGSGTVIQDTEIDGRNSTPGSVGIGWSGFTAERVNIHGTEDGVRLDGDVTVQDSYIHDLYTCGTCHNDGGQVTNGSHIRVQHNTINWPANQTSTLLVKSDLGPINDVLVDGNLLNGGGYTLYSCNGGYGYPTNMVVSNNRFGHGYKWGLTSFDGPVTWSNNIWDASGAIATATAR